MDNEITNLKNQIKQNKLSKLYVFFGEEVFLSELYIKKISELVPDMGFPEFNRITIDGKASTLTDVADALDSFPMMAEKKLVIISDSGAFGAKSPSDVKEYYINAFEKISDDTIVIIKEENVDKRSSVYKAAKKSGTTVEFKPLSEADLIAWVIREANRLGKKISRQNAALLVSISERGLGTLTNEINKLSSYSDEEITAPTIEKLASRSLEARVFDLCDHLMNRDSEKAVGLLKDLKTAGQSPYAILYLLYSAFEKMLKAQLLYNSHTPQQAIAAELSVPPFAAAKYISGAKAFSQKEIISLITSVPMLDLSIKRGEIGQWQAIEKIIFSTAKERIQ